MILVESAVGWSVQWPELVITSGVDSADYYSGLTDVTFWLPGIVAIGAVAAACFLIGGRSAGHGRVRGA